MAAGRGIITISAATLTNLRWAEKVVTVDMVVRRWEVAATGKESLVDKKGVMVDKKEGMECKKGVTADRREALEDKKEALADGKVVTADKRVSMVVCSQEVDKRCHMELKLVTKAVDMDTAKPLETDTITQTLPITKPPRRPVQATATGKAALAATMTTTSLLLHSMPVMTDLKSPTCSLQP